MTEVGSRPGRASTPDQQHLQQKWYWYDWACASYVTVTATVLFAPYLTSIANKAACPTQATDTTCRTNLHLLGIAVAPGSLVPYTLTISTIISALLIILAGSFVDRSTRPIRYLGGFCYVGAAAAGLMCLIAGSDWQFGVVLAVIANLCLAASLVVYNAIMCRITPPDDRDRISSKGWSYGYLGGGILLAANLVLLSTHTSMGLDTGQAVRISFAVSGAWWALFALIPLRGLRHLHNEPMPREGPAAASSIRQLRETFRELRRYPQTMRFLLSYLFYNDGIQTVIASASLYGVQQLKLSDNQMVITILLVQFVAFGGALAFGRMAGKYGAKRLVLASLFLWTAVVIVAFFIPERQFALWLVLAVCIGTVLGGSQSLSRSLYSHLVPHGRESEFFSLYQAMERGTSWLGTFIFGLVYQLFHDYRLSIVALIIFFGVGGALLRTVRVRDGIEAAGNTPPRVV
ncbi:MFS transporter [Leekyejoonella antrihumi]|uniref:MFS transporter n=1 Tax=Leekyejoonella antrihumi TaxID=1660198 RepID=A0A563E3P6_9MICO|nr:MFS transporter [Leekyejoonella antrihumi]TWP36852.1 MFS transporter [Leekyejoonella antrihumi]